AEALERIRQRTVLGADRGREPAFVDAAAVLGEREVVVRVQTKALRGRAERAGNPRRREAGHALASVHDTLERRLRGGDVLVRSCLRHNLPRSARPFWLTALFIEPISASLKLPVTLAGVKSAPERRKRRGPMPHLRGAS